MNAKEMNWQRGWLKGRHRGLVKTINKILVNELLTEGERGVLENCSRLINRMDLGWDVRTKVLIEKRKR